MSKKSEAQPLQPKHLGAIKELEFRHVSFQHQTASHKAIDDISFRTEKGETIAFVGPSGSGKSTLMKLLVGLYRPLGGNIFYNGLDENKIHFDDLRNQIGFVTQDTQLFSGTIRENLLFVNPKATEEDVLDALTKASCQNLLTRAEKGLDTMIGEGGLKLSGGEKQRLSIARALLRRPKLLIFDEATSALDTESERLVQQALENMMQNRTSVVIAHRLSTIQKADKIIVLDHGQVKEIGTHDDLLLKEGFYAQLHKMQYKEFVG